MRVRFSYFGTQLLFVILFAVSFTLLFISSKALSKNTGSFFKGSFGAAFNLYSDGMRKLSVLAVVLGRYKDISKYVQSITDIQDRRYSNNPFVTSLYQENNELRRQLKLSQELPYDYITARVISNDPSNYFSTLTISKGSQSGLKPGMVVIGFNGDHPGLVGRVKKVWPTTASVASLLSPSLYISAWVSTRQSIGLVTLRSRVAATLTMTLVGFGHNNSIRLGDSVRTSGMSGVYPPGLEIGKVSSFYFDQGAIATTVVARPAVDPARTKYVYVLHSAGVENDALALKAPQRVVVPSKMSKAGRAVLSAMAQRSAQSSSPAAKLERSKTPELTKSASSQQPTPAAKPETEKSFTSPSTPVQPSPQQKEKIAQPATTGRPGEAIPPKQVAGTTRSPSL